MTYLAEDAGYYKAEGIKVERIPMGGGPAGLTALLGGAGDVFIEAPVDTLTGIAKGQKLKILMGHANNLPSTFVLSHKTAAKIGVSADSPLADRQATLGKIRHGRYGITAPGSQTDGFTRYALRKAGVDPDKDAQLLPLQTASNCVAALDKGRIDGFFAIGRSARPRSRSSTPYRSSSTTRRRSRA